MPLPSQPPAQGTSVLVKVLVGFLVFILLVVLAVMGSCVYIGYRAKKKADEIQQAYKSNDLNKLAGALGVGSSKPGGSSDGSSSGSLRIPAAIRPRRSHFLPGTRPQREMNGEQNSAAPRAYGGDSDRAVWRRLRIHQANSKGGCDGVSLSYRADNVPNPLEGPAEIEWRQSPKGQRIGQRITYRACRGSANRARLHAMVWPQST